MKRWKNLFHNTTLRQLPSKQVSTSEAEKDFCLQVLLEIVDLCP